MYAGTATGISPESTLFENGTMRPATKYYILRPEVRTVRNAAGASVACMGTTWHVRGSTWHGRRGAEPVSSGATWVRAKNQAPLFGSGRKGRKCALASCITPRRASPSLFLWVLAKPYTVRLSTALGFYQYLVMIGSGYPS